MKKLFLILSVLLFCIIPTFATTLKGSVEYTVDSARLVAFQDVKKRTPITDIRPYLFDDMYYNNTLRCIPKNITYDDFCKPRKIVPFFANDKLDFYGIQYDKTPNIKLYYSTKGRLLKYEVNTFKGVYPYKTLSYDIYGRLININLVISENEAYIFDRNKKLIAHWLDDKCYNENGEVELTRQR